MLASKEPEISTTGIQVHHEQVNVVTYDEEPRLQEAHAFAVNDEGFTTQQPPPQNYSAQTPNTNPPHFSSLSYQDQHPTTPANTSNSPPPPTPPRPEGAGGGSFELLLCGSSTMHRLPPGHHVSVSLIGHTNIDIRDSPFTASSATVNVWIIRLIGSVRVLVRPGTQVVVRRLLLCGNRNVQVDPAEQDDNNNTNTAPPRIVLTILSLCGNIRVRSNPNDR
jgi:hypothetical protein